MVRMPGRRVYFGRLQFAMHSSRGQCVHPSPGSTSVALANRGKIDQELIERRAGPAVVQQGFQRDGGPRKHRAPVQDSRVACDDAGQRSQQTGFMRRMGAGVVLLGTSRGGWFVSRAGLVTR